MYHISCRFCCPSKESIRVAGVLARKLARRKILDEKMKKKFYKILKKNKEVKKIEKKKKKEYCKKNPDIEKIDRYSKELSDYFLKSSLPDVKVISLIELKAIPLMEWEQEHFSAKRYYIANGEWI